MGPQKPRTWNRQVATVRSFLSWCRRHGWPVGGLALRVDRRAVADDDAKAIPLAELERLWSRADVPLREQALWRLLCDSAARAEEALGLDVDDLDLANRQAKARTKGGYVRQLNFQTAAARLLAKLVAGRERGPVFLTGRRPGPRHRPGAAELRDGRAALQALLRRAARCTSSAIPA
jgi:integrase